MRNVGRGWIRNSRGWMLGMIASALVISSAAADDEAAAKRQQLGLSPIRPLSTVTIDNGITGDGRLEVVVDNGGETDTVNIDPPGPAPLQDIMFELHHYVDVGADGGAVQLGLTTITQQPTITGPNQVTSMGTFAGQNGTIAWTAVSSIAPGSSRYITTLSFSSANPFGTVRIIQYADIDVAPLGSNDLVELGTFGQSAFQLVTVQAPASGNVGMRQLMPEVTNATCVGWAAMPFAQLRGLITGAGTTYAPAGNIVNLGSMTDSRFPGSPAFGPADITAAIACDLNPSATSATVVMGISPEGNVASAVPTLSEWAIIAMMVMLAILAVRSLRRGRFHTA